MKSDKSRSPRKAAKPKQTATKADAEAQTQSQRTLKIPPLLLEGDLTAPPTPAGPGTRYALGPTPPPPHLRKPEPQHDLPEAYGTKGLLLAARDPQWLYAHWDFTREQLQAYNALSAAGHLVLRVYVDVIAGQPFKEIHVHPESRHCFVHVGRSGTRFVAEVGYHRPDRHWIAISQSQTTSTPPHTMSVDTSVQFATIPFEVPFQQMLGVVREAVAENVPLVEAMQQLRATGQVDLPEPESSAEVEWTAEQERALAQFLSMNNPRSIGVSSPEITELMRRQIGQEIASGGATQFSLPTPPAGALPEVSAVSSVSSPFVGAERKEGFWFNLNAELVIYGATEPTATVTLGGRPIKLRPDGTFSYRFALPDGKFVLPVMATSSDGTDTRGAALAFKRGTVYHGAVGAHPQDVNLITPQAANVA